MHKVTNLTIKANIKDYGVKESVELTIIDDNNLKDNSNGVIYSK